MRGFPPRQPPGPTVIYTSLHGPIHTESIIILDTIAYMDIHQVSYSLHGPVVIYTELAIAYMDL